MNNSEAGRHRLKCRIVAFIDVIWRLVEFTYGLIDLVVAGPPAARASELRGLGTIHQKLYTAHRFGPHGATMIAPLLAFLYILATILQMAVSCFIFKACNGRSGRENEIGACGIYFRVSLLSLFVVILLFIFPFILMSVLHIVYTGSRILFIFLGTLLVRLHIRNLEEPPIRRYDSTMVHIPF